MKITRHWAGHVRVARIDTNWFERLFERRWRRGHNVRRVPLSYARAVGYHYIMKRKGAAFGLLKEDPPRLGVVLVYLMAPRFNAFDFVTLSIASVLWPFYPVTTAVFLTICGGLSIYHNVLLHRRVRREAEEL